MNDNHVPDRLDPEMIVIDAMTPGRQVFGEWLAATVADRTASQLPRWLTPISPQPHSLQHTRTRCRAALVASMAVAVCLIAAVTTLRPGGHQPPISSGTGHATTVAANPPGDIEPVVSGNGLACCGTAPAVGVMGPRSSRTVDGVQAITRFEAAYYEARDARMAREVVAIDAAVPHAAEIQAGIDSVPPGTTYCVQIRRLVAGQYLVELTEVRPGFAESKWRQRISTATDGNGKHVITSITAA
ncbi:hypothetical protein [Nocardia sp. NPDC052566]|uniref:hypothetical protein n=1 Tax=Nocardia sp. NPDC052566 TaxID=3364330 RepID=UPI0037CC0349